MADSIATQHLLISGLAWLIGGGLGILVGYLCVAVIQPLFSVLPGLRGLATLLPWRTLILNLLLFVILLLSRRPIILNMLHLAGLPLAFTLTELGPFSDAIVVGLFIFLLTLPLTVIRRLETRWPSPPGVRFVADSRTFLTLSIVVTVIIGSFSGEGIGAFVSRRIGLLDFYTVLNEWGRIIGWVLAVDIASGIVQTIVFYLSARRQASETPPSKTD